VDSNESCWLGVGNQCSRVIDQQFLGCAAEVVQARFDGLKDRRLGFVQTDRVVLAAAVAQGHAEDDDLGQLAAQIDRVRGPIELVLPRTSASVVLITRSEPTASTRTAALRSARS